MIEVKRRPSAEHAGCGATGPLREMHAASCHGTSGQSLQCYGRLHTLAAADEPLKDRSCFRRAAKRRAAHLAVGSLGALSVTTTVIALSG
jgi:hypothetical protein